MGMTIDKAIEFFDGLEGHTPQAKDARNVAIDTMHKYQKIERYMEKLEKNGQYGTLRKLKIVLGEAE